MAKSKKVYNPQISLQSYQILQRLAWFDNIPMTKALDTVIYRSLELVNLEMVYQSCRAERKACRSCVIFVKL